MAAHSAVTGTTATNEVMAGLPVLLAGLLVNLVFSLPPYTAGIFMVPLGAEFGWSRAEISVAVTVLTIGMAVGGFVVGRIQDRLDIRLLIACGMAVYAAAYFALSRIGASLGAFWSIFAVMAALGAMASPMTVSRIIADHFNARRGFALGFTMVGSGLAALVAPLTLVPFIHQHGWRAGYIALGAFVLLLVPFVTILLARTGRAERRDSQAIADASRQPDKRVLLTLVAAIACISLAVGGAVVHLIPMLTDAGLERGQVASLAGLVGAAVIVSRLAVGAIFDRLSSPIVAATIMALASLGFLFVSFSGRHALYAAPVVVGAALGAELDIAAFLTMRLFPRSAYSRCFGTVFFTFQMGLAISPIIYALAHDWCGNYQAALQVSTILLGASSVLFSLLPRIRPVAPR
ncbi:MULTISPECIES: MFS transporter [unclassified Mesorhizobium]|uniref:MFS transporter n=1 Tax=unclassified Mesorhizobium TaxID=325217 RepID=UPI001FEE7004|nr:MULTISPECIES: MFS transporter [unclassified Mesorhizobium]